MDYIEELKAILKKMRSCEKMANKRMLKARSTPNLIPIGHMPADFYEGQANGFRNSAHYIERLLQCAGEKPCAENT